MIALDRVDADVDADDDRVPKAPDVDVRESDDRRRGARDSPSLMMLVLVATIGVLLYTTFLFDFSNRGNWIPYLMVLTAESVIIVQALLPRCGRFCPRGTTRGVPDVMAFIYGQPSPNSR